MESSVPKQLNPNVSTGRPICAQTRDIKDRLKNKKSKTTEKNSAREMPDANGANSMHAWLRKDKEAPACAASNRDKLKSIRDKERGNVELPDIANLNVSNDDSGLAALCAEDASSVRTKLRGAGGGPT